MKRLMWLVMFLATCHMVGTGIGLVLSASHPRPTNYRATLYDGGQVISAWICHDYGSDGEGVRLTLREGGEVWVRGTLIIEQVPARTEVR
jgi:hypothetical protein